MRAVSAYCLTRGNQKILRHGELQSFVSPFWRNDVPDFVRESMIRLMRSKGSASAAVLARSILCWMRIETCSMKRKAVLLTSHDTKRAS